MSSPIDPTVSQSHSVMALPHPHSIGHTFSPSSGASRFKLRDASQIRHLSPTSQTQVESPIHLISQDAIDSYKRPTEQSSFRYSPSLTTGPTLPQPNLKHEHLLPGNTASISKFKSEINPLFSSPSSNSTVVLTPLSSPISLEPTPATWCWRQSPPIQYTNGMKDELKSTLVIQSDKSVLPSAADRPKRPTRQSLMSVASVKDNETLQVNEKNMVDCKVQNKICNNYLSQPEIVPNDRIILIARIHASLFDLNQIKLIEPLDHHMQQEPICADQVVSSSPQKLPTPPPSRQNIGCQLDPSVSCTDLSKESNKGVHEYFEAYSRDSMKLRRWKSLKVLGKGTFSRVILATSQCLDDEPIDESPDMRHLVQNTGSASILKRQQDQKLVAVKICNLESKGGVSEEKVAMSVKREIELMKDVNHPSIVYLKAWIIEQSRAVLILDYCPGGDLFDLASEHYDLLVPSLLRRIFAELVEAVRYLHAKNIVHRDIKLENVLVNLSPSELRPYQDWNLYPYSVVTLSDLGLARRIIDNEKLTTKCGSYDYVAPEIIMGQAYDGRATDAWSLGVLLYALLEGRLPFDLNPDDTDKHHQRNRTSHRIARSEWYWIKYSGSDEEHHGDVDKFRCHGLLDAMQITEGLLCRARCRWTVDQVADTDWLKNAINFEASTQLGNENYVKAK